MWMVAAMAVAIIGGAASLFTAHSGVSVKDGKSGGNERSDAGVVVTPPDGVLAGDAPDTAQPDAIEWNREN